jgi:uncharacterized protein (TIGR02058 family)
MVNAAAGPLVLEFGMGVDVHGQDATKAARRAVSDAIRHSSLPLLGQIRERGGTMLVHVTVAVPEPEAVDLAAVKQELPHGEVSVEAVKGGLRVPNSDALIACASIHVSAEPEAGRGARRLRPLHPAGARPGRQPAPD